MGDLLWELFHACQPQSLARATSLSNQAALAVPNTSIRLMSCARSCWRAWIERNAARRKMFITTERGKQTSGASIRLADR
ncbi:hypothetical protein IFHNHDMJ_00837 [Synechococcus sp. CBW1107]|nr:hypothetical protein IFHNHDMJ_00837 [Synechococcus sp. CBW1107]